METIRTRKNMHRPENRPFRKVVDRVKRDGSEIDVLECGHEVFAKWIGRGYDAPAKRRCTACQYAPKGGTE